MNLTQPVQPVSVFHVKLPNDPVAVRVTLTEAEGSGTVEAQVSHPRFKGQTMHRRHTRGDTFVQVYAALVASFGGEFAFNIVPEGAEELPTREAPPEDPETALLAKELARKVVAFARAPSALYEAGKAWAKACVAFKPGECARHDTLLASREADAQELTALALKVNPDAAKAPKRPV